MQAESFTPGKDASPESTINNMLDGELRFFDRPSPGLKLADCDMHQRLLARDAKLHRN